MKRMLAVLMMIFLAGLCAGALADDYAGPAATAVRAGLYDAPQEGAAELMRYYIGVRVEVVREVDSKYVQVNVGEPGGSLTGYMRKEELAFGEKALRGVQAESVTYSGERCRLYSYFDTRSPVIDEDFDINYKSVLGFSGDAWLHVENGLGATGFVSLQEAGLTGPDIRYAIFTRVQPAPDELPFEDAIAYAREKILEDAQTGVYQDGEIDADVLAACRGEVTAYYYYEMPDAVVYCVSFWMPDGERYYAGIDFTVQGMQIVKESYGNG